MTTSALLLDLGLARLADHWPALLLSTAICQLVFLMAVHRIAPLLAIYRPPSPRASRKDRAAFAAKCVSLVHATVVSLGAFAVISDPVLIADPVFGYSPRAGNVMAITCGYFLWDTVYSISGGELGFVLHGVSCFTVYILSFRPFLQYYGGVFLMFELSTPFLNIHHFCDKTGNSGTVFQLVNGIILLLVFFGARIVFGFYSSARFWVSIYENFDRLPLHLPLIYGIANILLNGLNVFWFYKMVSSALRRTSDSDGGKKGKASAEDGGASPAKKDN